MASTIAAPVPQSHPRIHSVRKDMLQVPDGGRDTPLPQYEKSQSVPFTLTLQEEKNNPGQFQLVVNVDPKYKKPSDGSPPRPAASKKLIANLKEVPSLGYDVSPLYQTQRSSPPTSPQDERQGWSDLDAIPPEFLQKVVPDWKVTFSRSDSTASAQSRKLADIKARIKKSGKGFVVRLLKGSSADNNEVAEVHLGQNAQLSEPASQELDSQELRPRVELDAAEVGNSGEAQHEIFEIGTSGEPGIPRPVAAPSATRNPSVQQWLNQTAIESSRRTSVFEESFSDAETLLPDVRSVADRLEEQTDNEPLSRNSFKFPTRSESVLSIVKTPTRGLSVVGHVKRIEKHNRVRSKGKAARFDLNRSDAHKSVKRHSSRTPTDILSSSGPGLTQRKPSSPRDASLPVSREHFDSSDESGPIKHDISQSSSRNLTSMKPKTKRRASTDQPAPKPMSKSGLRLQTDVGRPNSANTSPVTRRKRSPRHQRLSSTTSSSSFIDETKQNGNSPIWSEVDASDDIREALERAFGTVADDLKPTQQKGPISIPRIEEPISDGEVGEIPLPPELEIRSTPLTMRSPTATFWGLALSAFSEKIFETFQALRDKYGSEPPVPPNHVRVRWTCSCGEPLYDDFIERRPGAARLLEAYLNRAQTHSPNSPQTRAPTRPHSRSSTSTSMSSVFDSASRASTLATPASTYGGAASWSKTSDASKYSPTRLRMINPFSVRMPTFVEESWLLTCANEGRFTPKIVHLDVNAGKIRSDKDLALALRDHYERLNRRWLKWARLRGLTTIEFVQFEVHRNRFADIRATPSMPPTSSSTNEKSPSPHPYTFEPVDLVPPVGSAYLLHLFKHPEDYDGELITYLRAPKRRERLEFGMGWGINLVEGFLAQKVWSFIMACFGVGSAVFALLWSIKKHDVQGAFGIAGWVVTLAGLILGTLQAWLE